MALYILLARHIKFAVNIIRLKVIDYVCNKAFHSKIHKSCYGMLIANRDTGLFGSLVMLAAILREICVSIYLLYNECLLSSLIAVPMEKSRNMTISRLTCTFLIQAVLTRGIHQC